MLTLLKFPLFSIRNLRSDLQYDIPFPERATVAYNGVARRWNKAKIQTHT